jgi:lipid-binding SYLF domain-containing protein
MKAMKNIMMLGALLTLSIGVAHADSYSDALKTFKNAKESAKFFSSSYGYALFPTIGQGGFVVGGFYGKGQVYVHGKAVAKTSATQVNVGFQAGGQAYSQIIFFQDKRAFDEFATGKFAFSADMNAVAITAAASASANTTGSNASASGGKNDAVVAGGYQKGMAVFTIAKGGLMYAATVGGQKFSYKPLTAK